MVKLALIKSGSARNNISWAGDILGIFGSDHDFSEDEKSQFRIVSVSTTPATVKSTIDKMLPDLEDGEYVKYPTYLSGTISDSYTLTEFKDALKAHEVVS